MSPLAVGVDLRDRFMDESEMCLKSLEVPLGHSGSEEASHVCFNVIGWKLRGSKAPTEVLYVICLKRFKATFSFGG